MGFPKTRMRRLRATPALRRMVRETALSVDDLIAPLFVRPGRGVRSAIRSMPGQCQWSVDTLVDECQRLADLGVPAVLLFGIPETKDAVGSASWADDGIVQRAVRAIKAACSELVVITDVCFCEYTARTSTTTRRSRTWRGRPFRTCGRGRTWSRRRT
jgi:porphobilinogen synthase